MNLKNLFKLRNLPYLVMLATLSLFSGCITYKKCADKFAWKSDTIKTVVYRDTIIPVLIHGTDTVYRKTVITDTILVSSGNAHAKVYTIHDTTRVYLWQTDTLLKVKLDSALKDNIILNKQVTTVIEKAKIDKILKWVFACLFVLLLIILVPRILKKK